MNAGRKLGRSGGKPDELLKMPYTKEEEKRKKERMEGRKKWKCVSFARFRVVLVVVAAATNTTTTVLVVVAVVTAAVADVVVSLATLW